MGALRHRLQRSAQILERWPCTTLCRSWTYVIFSASCSTSPDPLAGNDLRSEISAALQCKIEWLKRFARPYPRNSPLYRNERDNSPETHINVLQRCLQVIPFLPDPPEYSTFCVWHPDLQASNIMIDETGPLTPRYYLDWQLATIDALLEVSVPPFLEYGGNKYVEAEYGSSSMPDLPAEFDQLPEAEQLVAKKERRLTTRSNYYNFVTERWNPALHAADFS